MAIAYAETSYTLSNPTGSATTRTSSTPTYDWSAKAQQVSSDLYKTYSNPSGTTPIRSGTDPLQQLWQQQAADKAYWESIYARGPSPVSGTTYDPLYQIAKNKIEAAKSIPAYSGTDIWSRDLTKTGYASPNTTTAGNAQNALYSLGYIPFNWTDIDNTGRLKTSSLPAQNTVQTFYTNTIRPESFQANQGWTPGSVANQGYSNTMAQLPGVNALQQGALQNQFYTQNLGSALANQGYLTSSDLQALAQMQQAGAGNMSLGMTSLGQQLANQGQAGITSQMAGYYGNQDARAQAAARLAQMQGAQTFADIASGKAPTVAELQTPLMKEAARRQALSTLASSYAGNNPAALRNAVMSGSDAATQIAAQAIPQIAQERQAAAQQYQNVLGNVRGADISSLAQYNAALQAANQARLGYAGLGTDYGQLGLGYGNLGATYGNQAQAAANLGLGYGQLQNQFANTALGYGGQATDIAKLGLGYNTLGQQYAQMQQAANQYATDQQITAERLRLQNDMNKLSMLYGQPPAPMSSSEKALQTAGNITSAAAPFLGFLAALL